MYHQKTTDVQSYFENLSYADDYFAQFDDNDDNEDTGIFQFVPPAPADPKDALLCKVCYSQNVDCMLMPCKHACCCFECYQTWVKVDVRRLENDFLTEDERDIFLSDEPIQLPTCPICRAPIENALSGIKFT